MQNLALPTLISLELQEAQLLCHADQAVLQRRELHNPATLAVTDELTNQRQSVL